MPNNVSKREVLTRIMLQVFRLNSRIMEKGDLLAAPVRLTSARWQVLGAVALAKQPLTAPQIAEAMGISRQGVQKQLNRMVEENLFEVIANPRHERSPLYALTTTGQAAYAQIMQRHEQWVETLASTLKRTDLQAASMTLDTIFVRLEAVSATLEEDEE